MMKHSHGAVCRICGKFSHKSHFTLGLDDTVIHHSGVNCLKGFLKENTSRIPSFAPASSPAPPPP